MKRKNDVVQNLAMITQVGISMLAPVVLCVFAGYWMELKFGWSITLPLLILGIMAGIRNTWILMKNIIEEEKGDRKDG